MNKQSNKGFTLIELLAVIVLLAIILAVAVPSITGVIKSSTMSAFESDAKMIFQAVKYKQLQDADFDPLLITKENMETLVGLDSSYYEQVDFKIDTDNNLRLMLVGSNKWQGLIACGTIRNISIVQTVRECEEDKTPPVISIIGNQTIGIGKGLTYYDAGATATDVVDGTITDKITVSNLVDTALLGTYTVVYTVTDDAGNTATATRTVNVVDKTYIYAYTGNYQTFTTPSDGFYKIELWGAQGNAASKGAYTAGNLNLTKNENLYVYVGQGNLAVANGTTFNGGSATVSGVPGGGATDVRLASGTWNNFDSLKSRIMVAAGAGSGYGNTTVDRGYGGALTGGASGTAGATQTSASASAYAVAGFGYALGGCAGGNGYYAGGGAACDQGAGGGSSFISGYTGCNAISATSTSSAITHTGSPNHYSGKIFANGVMIAGNASMPTQNGASSMIGNAGSGYAKLTYLGPTGPSALNLNIVGANPNTTYSGFTYSDPGVTATDVNGVDLLSNVTATSTVNPNVPGTYYVTYTLVDYDGNYVTKTRTVNVVSSQSAFGYNGAYQTFTAYITGTYKIELWGASASGSARGAYTSGTIALTKNEVLYIFVGQIGGNYTSFNGGGGTGGGVAGGGATDVRLASGTWNNFDSLKSRIMVAAGAGSANANINLGYGGTLAGGNGGGTAGATQTSSSASAYAVSGFGYADGGCAGGSGYYGAGGAACASGGGGGSSFISGYTGCNAISATSTSSAIVHTNQPNHYSGKVFTGGVMVAGNASMPTLDGASSMIGNSGNGYAKITIVGY